MRTRFEWPKDVTPPFFDLVCFSDCEGTIGPKSCAALAKDFAEWKERMEAHYKSVGEGDQFKRVYDDFMAAFTATADVGVVDFH